MPSFIYSHNYTNGSYWYTVQYCYTCLCMGFKREMLCGKRCRHPTNPLLNNYHHLVKYVSWSIYFSLSRVNRGFSLAWIVQSHRSDRRYLRRAYSAHSWVPYSLDIKLSKFNQYAHIWAFQLKHILMTSGISIYGHKGTDISIDGHKRGTDQ